MVRSEVTGYSALVLAGTVIRIVLGGIFLLAGGLKWTRTSTTDSIALAAGFRSGRLLQFGLVTIPISELLVGSWLVLGWHPAEALAAATVLLTFFTAVLAVAVRHGYTGGCSCFGIPSVQQVGWLTFLRNIILLAVASFAQVASWNLNSSSELWNLPVQLPITALMLTAALVAIYALNEELGRATQRQSWPSVVRKAR